MMRVTFVSFDDDPPQGGQGVVLHGMREALKRRKVHAHTISGRGTHRVPYARITGRPPLDLSLQLNRNRSILYRDEPDLIHAFGGPGGVLVWRPLLLPLVYTAHHTYRQAFGRTSPRRVLSPLEARAYRRAAKVLPVSKSTADAVMALGVAANRIEVVPNGIDMPAVDGVQREPGRLLFVGRLEVEKGVLDALSVMESIGRERSDVRGIIVGTGRLRETVNERATQSAGRIEYLGTIDGDQLAREYARAALVLVPSRYEGLGMVALEAQLCGTPVAGYDVDGLHDAISDGGVLVRPGDTAGLRQAALALLDEPSRRAELGARGRERVQREHSWDQVGERLAAIYAEVLRAA
jgi:glycosyltransferase involved in cell wall biosynthesis